MTIISTSSISSDLRVIRAALGKCGFGAHKEIGLRKVREGLDACRRSLPEWGQRCLMHARMELRYAQADTERQQGR